jgi:hypothetical protein
LFAYHEFCVQAAAAIGLDSAFPRPSLQHM